MMKVLEYYFSLEFQHIPTDEKIQLLQDWDKFFIILEENPVCVKMYNEL